MAPPPSSTRYSQVKRASVTSNAGPSKQKLMTPKDMIDETLLQFNIEELRDVIRVAQRHLKAKVHERKSADQANKQTWRFWDRPLSMDWSDVGIPKVQFPRGRSHTDSELGWSPFNFLAGMAQPPMKSIDWKVFQLLSQPRKVADVDWDVLALMSPKVSSDEQALKFMGDDEDDVEELLEIDWSESRLPCYNTIFSVRRRRRRVLDQRRCRHPQPASANAPTESPAVVAKRSAMRQELAPRVPASALRATRRPTPRNRIQQPGGGAAHVRGVSHRM